MLSNFAMLRTAFTAASLAVIMQPAAALHRVHSYHHASRAAVPVPPARRDTPSYDDPSRFGGDSAMGPEAASSSVAAVHVQPRGSGFAPNSK
jgi:hypothetical protein